MGSKVSKENITMSEGYFVSTPPDHPLSSLPILSRATSGKRLTNRNEEHKNRNEEPYSTPEQMALIINSV